MTSRANPPLPMAPRPLAPAALVFAIAVWGLLVVAGLKWFKDYKTTAGALPEAPPTWPAGSALPRASGLFNLVLFLHPKCDCSRATLSELGEIMSRSVGRAKAVVVFLHPVGVAADWSETGTWSQAAAIPDTVRVQDLGGAEALRFGAATSGTLRVYDPNGALRFSGGITSSRGHAGDNVGRETVLGLLAGGPVGRATHDVFGCALRAPPPSPGARP